MTEPCIYEQDTDLWTGLDESYEHTEPFREAMSNHRAPDGTRARKNNSRRRKQ